MLKKAKLNKHEHLIGCATAGNTIQELSLLDQPSMATATFSFNLFKCHIIFYVNRHETAETGDKSGYNDNVNDRLKIKIKLQLCYHS